jgi:uncharacterized protein (DUF983 family)
MPDGQRTVARAVRLLARGLCLRCPRCGAHSLFRTWFAMYERCTVCQLRFEREQGYFLGAMYINYGVTVVLALIGSFTLEYWVGLSLTQQLVLWVGFCSFFPVVFFRHSRGLWLAFDYIFDPVTDERTGERDDQVW